jgi:hypothetical protein
MWPLPRELEPEQEPGFYFCLALPYYTGPSTNVGDVKRRERAQSADSVSYYDHLFVLTCSVPMKHLKRIELFHRKRERNDAVCRNLPAELRATRR